MSSVRADGKHIVGAVFGGKTAATRNALMRSLLYAALQDASTSKTREPAKLIAPMLARFMASDRAFAKARRSADHSAASTPVST